MPAGGMTLLEGRLPTADDDPFAACPLWDVHPTFSEYFDGDSGVGLGASHQTGWTALVAHFVCAPDGIANR